MGQYTSSPGRRGYCYTQNSPFSSLAVVVTIDSTHCAYPRRDGQAELAWVAGYVVRQFSCPKAVTHPSTNRAQCIETNALPLHAAKRGHKRSYGLNRNKTSLQLAIIMPLPPYGEGIKRWWPSSPRLSVCPVPDPKSRMEGHSKMKIGKKEAYDTGDPQWCGLRP